MTDMLMCLTGLTQSERGRETMATDRQEKTERGGKRCWCSLPLATRPPSALWQMHGNESCVRWNSSLPFPCTFTVCSSFCLAYFPLLFLSHTCTDVYILGISQEKKNRGTDNIYCYTGVVIFLWLEELNRSRYWQKHFPTWTCIYPYRWFDFYSQVLRYHQYNGRKLNFVLRHLNYYPPKN